MISRKTELVLMVAIFAIIFTTCVYVFPSKYAHLWLSLEVITIPTLYLVGYELLMHKQKRVFEEETSLLNEVVEKQYKEIIRLKMRLKK